jgi:hypothetical protein
VQDRSRESSAESSPGSRAPTCALAGPQGRVYKRSFSSVSDISLPLACGSSSSLGYVYSRGTATPAPTLGSTVKLVRGGRCTVTSLPSSEEIQSTTYIQSGESKVPDQVSDDEQGATSRGEKATASNAPVKEKPQLSWTMTLSLLIFVTIVRPLLPFVAQFINPLLARCHQCRVTCRIHG